MAAFDSELGQTSAADRSDQVPEWMDAGFLPRGRASGPAITNLARGGCGTGFASGAELDTALPGPALAGFAGKTPGQIRAMIGRAILRVDPDAARERREQAQRDARVELWREDVGTAALCGFGLPPDEALAADQMISSRVLELKAAGMAGTMDQLRARAYLDILLGQDSSPVLAGQDSSARQSTEGAGPAQTEGQGPADDQADTPGRAADEPGSPRPGAAGADTSELPNSDQPGRGSSQSGRGTGGQDRPVGHAARDQPRRR